MALGFDLRLGIDVGGTNTDAVVLDRDNKVIAKTKQSTTADVTTGIKNAIECFLVVTICFLSFCFPGMSEFRSVGH